MTTDTVDDLHAAEDLLGVLALALQRVSAAPTVDDAQRAAASAIADYESFCRPSCGYRETGECADGGDPGCGCPCNHEPIPMTAAELVAEHTGRTSFLEDPTKLVEVEVIATATLVERWTFRVPDAWDHDDVVAAFQDNNVDDADAPSDTMEYVSCVNVKVYDERDRDPVEVRDATA